MAWQKSLKNAPRDGEPILAYASSGEYPFVVYWGGLGRFTDMPDAWIGHESGALQDHDIIGWQKLPSTYRT